MDTNGRVVVGYDGSREAGQAVRWAAHHAQARRCGLHLVHCSLWPEVADAANPVTGGADPATKHSAETIVAEGVASVREAAPGLELTTSLVYGWPAENLRKLSSRAALLVVGSRGMGGFMGLLVGSVSLELAGTALCPVAVIREHGHTGGPILVGVSNEYWESVVGQAALFASVMGADLRIAHVMGRAESRSPKHVAAARETLASAVRSVGNTWPELRIEDLLLTGVSVAGTLLAAADHAQMVVVGPSARGSVRASIGSSAHAVLHHAGCPVLVVRQATGQTLGS